MGRVIVGMTMSLDGYVNDRAGSVEPLFPDFDLLRDSERLRESVRDTGAVVMGRKAFAMGEPDSYAGGYEYQVPIFVLVHRPPERRPKEAGALTFTFVTDGIGSAVRQARAAAEERDVTIIGGPRTARQALQADLVDELQLDLMPVLLGGGLRLFDDGGAALRLERVEVEALPRGRTYLRFRVGR